MSRIIASATASPEYRLDAATMKSVARRFLGDSPHLPVLLRVIERSGIEARQLALPPERLLVPRPFGDKNADFIATAVPLAEQALRGALHRAALSAARIDLVVTTSCTGLMIPSLSTFLAPRVGLRDDVVRLPITELGCAAGAAAIARANDFLLAHPGRIAAVLACELPSLTLQPQDRSMTNFVASAIFGDGAACLILAGARAPVVSDERPAPEVIGSRSHLFADSRRLMGFDVGEGGLHIVLARDVPEFLAGKVAPLVDALCRDHRIERSSLGFAAIHPGGRKILATLEADLGISGAATQPSWDVLAEHGNMSSATVLFVVDRLIRDVATGRAPAIADGCHGLLAAFGPGFAAELSLLRWRARRASREAGSSPDSSRDQW